MKLRDIDIFRAHTKLLPTVWPVCVSELSTSTSTRTRECIIANTSTGENENKYSAHTGTWTYTCNTRSMWENINKAVSENANSQRK